MHFIQSLQPLLLSHSLCTLICVSVYVSVMSLCHVSTNPGLFVQMMRTLLWSVLPTGTENKRAQARL